MSTPEQHHDDNKRKRAPANQYRKHNNNNNNRKNKKHFNPKRGNPGILLSCEPGKELKCRREGLDILLHYYHQLIKQQQTNGKEQEEETPNQSLEDELSMLKKMNETKKIREDNLPFTVYDTGCRGMVFLIYNPDHNDNYKNDKDSTILKECKKMKMTSDQEETAAATRNGEDDTNNNTHDIVDVPSIPTYNPIPILESIYEDIIITQSNKCPSSRFILKMIPIQITCFASVSCISIASKTLIDTYLIPNLVEEEHGDKKQNKCIINFEVQFQRRICNNVTREDVISNVADLVLSHNDDKDKNYEFKVNLTKPEYTIMIQICKTTCGISIIRNYNKFMKFNLFSLRSSVGDGDKSDGLEMTKSHKNDNKDE